MYWQHVKVCVCVCACWALCECVKPLHTASFRLPAGHQTTQAAAAGKMDRMFLRGAERRVFVTQQDWAAETLTFTLNLFNQHLYLHFSVWCTLRECALPPASSSDWLCERLTLFMIRPGFCHSLIPLPLNSIILIPSLLLSYLETHMVCPAWEYKQNCKARKRKKKGGKKFGKVTGGGRSKGLGQGGWGGWKRPQAICV